MAKSSVRKTEGISSGGTYLRIDKIERIRRLLSWQGEAATDERVRQMVNQLFIFSDEQVGQMVAQLEFKVAAGLAFPDQASAIEDIYQDALRIAHLRRTADDLRPPEMVRIKLIQEVGEFHDTLSMVEQGARDRPDLLLRLASVIYYAVQDFGHDLRLLVVDTQAVSLETVVKSLQVLVGDCCTKAQVPIPTGLEAARRKFGFRSIAANMKDHQVERKLMEDLVAERASDVPSGITLELE